MKRREFLPLALLFVGLRIEAADGARSVSDGNYKLELPPGYIGPVEHVEGTSTSRGFRKPYAGTALNTVILITVHEFGSSFERRLVRERVSLTRESLNEILAGIEKNRGDFRRSILRTVTIAGHSGMKATWSGSAQGIPFEGTVYCVLAGPRAYAVQIQDPTGRGGARMAEAVRAVEAMQILR